MWSLGVITYCLLAGYPPFPGPDLKLLFRQILAADYQFHEEFWHEVSSEAKDFISKLLVLDPTARMTADQAMAHPWIKMAESDLAVKVLRHAMQNFQTFNAGKKLKGATKAIIAAGRMKRLMMGVRAAAEESVESVEGKDVPATTLPAQDDIATTDSPRGVLEDEALTSSILGDGAPSAPSVPHHATTEVEEPQTLVDYERVVVDEVEPQQRGLSRANQRDVSVKTHPGSAIESDFAFRRALGSPADAIKAKQAQYADLVRRHVQWNKIASNGAGIYVAEPRRGKDMGAPAVGGPRSFDLYFGHGAEKTAGDWDSGNNGDREHNSFVDSTARLDNRDAFRRAELGYPISPVGPRGEGLDPALYPTYFFESQDVGAASLAFAPVVPATTLEPNGSPPPQRPRQPPSSANVALRHAREGHLSGTKDAILSLTLQGHSGSSASSAPPVGTITDSGTRFITRRVTVQNTPGILFEKGADSGRGDGLPTLDVLETRALHGRTTKK
jgi:hypothetical protein